MDALVITLSYVLWGFVFFGSIGLVLGSAWRWGGAKRHALGQIAAGAIYLVSGTLFTYVAQINVFARMDNGYLGNEWFGAFLVILGFTLLVASLAGYGVPWWGVVLCWLAVAAFYVYHGPLLAGLFPGRGATDFAFVGILLIVISAYVLARRYGWEVLTALALAWVGIVATWLVYGAGTEAFTPVDTIVDPVIEPPMLGLLPLAFSLFAGVAALLAGRAIQGRLRGPQSRLQPANAPLSA